MTVHDTEFTVHGAVHSEPCTVNRICPHFGQCGGCSKQNLSYQEQLMAKEKIVRDHLAEFVIHDFHSILPSPDIHFYRNKMEFSFGNEKDMEILGRPIESPRAHLGLHPKGRFALVTPTPECQLLSEESRKICAVVEEWAHANKVSIYVRKSGHGDLRHLVIREGKNTNERLVNLVSKSSTPHLDDLAERLKASGLLITTFLWTPYDGLSDVAKGETEHVYWGEGFIHEKIGSLRFRVNSSSFMQTNTRAAEAMLKVLRSWVGEERVLIDLYCGSGTIGLNLADCFDTIVGIELNSNAVTNAKQIALLNLLTNVEFLEGKAEDLAPGLKEKYGAAGTTLVLDPPRAGLHPKMVETLLSWSVSQICYVSCNPESLARDLRVLTAKYVVRDVQPMDFFPHTDHIETAVRLIRAV